MKKLVAMACACSVLLAGCREGEESQQITYRFVKTETLGVASEKGIYMGMGCWPCTMLRAGASGQWFAANVGGFDYEPGYEYVVEADKYRVIVPSGMCYDGPGESYVLKRVVSKVKRETPGIAWPFPCYDSWPGMPSQWVATPSDVLHVIRSQEELDHFSVAVESEFENEFEQYSVLLVAGTSNSGIAKITRSLTYKGGGKYLFVVEITRNAATVMQPWRVAVLVPAIPQDATVALKINYL